MMRRHNSLRRSAALGSAAVALVAVAGCGSSGGNAQNSAAIPTTGAVTGTLQFDGSEDPSVYQPLISGFEAANPGITVKYTEVPFAQYTSVLQQRLSAHDSSLDIFAVDQPNVASFAAHGYLQNLNQIGAAVKQSVIPTQYDVNVYKGTLYAAPISTSDQYLFYNTDLLKKAAVALPSSDPTQAWTWEQTLDAAQKAQQAGAADGLILEQTTAYYQLQPLSESAGGGSGLGGANNLTPDITNADWLKAMNWYHDLYSDGVAPRGVNPYSTFPLFTAGKVALFVGGPWDISSAASTKGLDWGMAAMPYFAGGKRVTPTGGWSLGINPASKLKPAALKFLTYASVDPAGDLLFTKNEANIPANSQALAQYLPTLGGLGGRSSADAAAITQYDVSYTAVARPVSVGYPQFETIMDQAFTDIQDGTSASSALNSATQQITEAMRQYQ